MPHDTPAERLRLHPRSREGHRRVGHGRRGLPAAITGRAGGAFLHPAPAPDEQRREGECIGAQTFHPIDLHLARSTLFNTRVLNFRRFANSEAADSAPFASRYASGVLLQHLDDLPLR